ncbi:hypothetical protein D7Y09_02080 [bacterium 1XD42-1]|nr:hypothetical protein D7X25_02630 [bacterium 1XD42-8]RKJ66896.1 hypothetical protein D7Y09_02080 [bacterium 1XD42-1]
MFFFDLHCDTLTETNEKGRGLLNDGFQLSIDRLPDDRWCQCFAIYIPDNLRGPAATAYFERTVRFYQAQLRLHVSRMQTVRTSNEIETALDAGRVACMLTVENGSVLAGDIKNVRKLAQAGVKILTLTWNGANEIAGGQENGEGLSFFGRMATSVLEQNGVILDVSHLSDRAFDDLAQHAKRPFIATHSNSRAVFGHKRNLTDRQFEHIVSIGGLVGINFYPQFINGGKDCTFEEIADHIQHFLSLGGENTIALGSDFDGAAMPSWLAGVQDIPAFYNRMVSEFGQEQTDKIFGGNALAFFRRYEALDLLLGALRE